MRHRRFILFGLALLMFAAPVFADGELGAGQKIVVRYFAGGKLAKSVTVTPDGDAVWTVKDASILSKIDTARAFVVSGSNETPIGGAAAPPGRARGSRRRRFASGRRTCSTSTSGTMSSFPKRCRCVRTG
ncbi:MAG: hypothetical protein M5R36_17375 [Deltaproteobacteria bacterium]|nr:hypothetical protein [Deltaproteobacteria bacterium]